MSTSLATLGRLTGYPSIAASIREQIIRGELPPGEQLPPIGALAGRYRTTAITVRRALRVLEEEGLVRVEHGVGTYVTDWLSGFDRLNLPGFAEEIAGSDRVADATVLDRKSGVVARTIALRLGLPEETPLELLVRLRRADGVPVAYQESYLSGEAAEIVRAYSAKRSLYEMLWSRTGRIPVSAREELRAAVLPLRAVGALGVRTDSVGWISRRVTYDAAGQAMVYDEGYFPSERVAMSVERTAQQAVLRYEFDLDSVEQRRSRDVHS